jgi:hypothetical protein
LTAEVGGWQLEVSPAQELAPEGNTSWSQWSEYEVGVRWSPPWKDVSLEQRSCWKLLPSNVTENTGLCVILICEV